MKTTKLLFTLVLSIMAGIGIAANGNSDKFSISELFFGDFDGSIWRLPYEMKNDFEKPVKVY